MCAAETGISRDEFLGLSLASAVALSQAVHDKIARQDAMHASIARMIYLCSPAGKRQRKLSDFMLFTRVEE